MRLLPTLLAAALLAAPFEAHTASVKPGDTITPENAALVADLVSPGNFYLVRQGMRMKIAPTERLEWPPPYKAATEKYAPQVSLNEKGELQNYVAGQPFPLLDPNDPQVAVKAMWNFTFRPQYTDDVDIRDVEINTTGAAGPTIEHLAIGHFAFYNNMGRTEVNPIPTDPEATGADIRYRFGAFPFLDPEELRGFGMVRIRSRKPGVDDEAWSYNPTSRKLRAMNSDSLSDAMGPVGLGGGGGGILPSVVATPTTYANNLDPDSFFGFAAKIENYDYKLLGLKPMLAAVDAENTPARPCQFDNGRSVCPEAWQLRQLYVIEATAKPKSWHQKDGSSPLRISTTARESCGRRSLPLTPTATVRCAMPRSLSILSKGCFRPRWSMKTSRTEPRRWFICRAMSPMTMRAGTSTWES